MASSDERREVALALRGDPKVTAIEQTRDGFEHMTYHEAAYRFWNMCRRVSSVTNADIAYGTCSVLADLIEPQERTCHNVSCYDNIFQCSECRAKLRLFDEDSLEPVVTLAEGVGVMPNHCPGCGARITEVDDA